MYLKKEMEVWPIPLLCNALGLAPRDTGERCLKKGFGSLCVTRVTQ